MKRVVLSSHLFLVIACLSGCVLGDLAADESDWRDSIVANPNSEPGCFHAAYPDTAWEPVACSTAPTTLNTPAVHPLTVGDGSDYALGDSGKIAKASGTFIFADDVTSETSDGSANSYLLSLNTNPIASPAACQGGGSGCESWEEFLYITDGSAADAFIYDALIGYGSSCPPPVGSATPWFNDGQGDCVLNSVAVGTPAVAASDLATVKLGGRAIAGGNDTVVFVSDTDAFSSSVVENATDLAGAWDDVEFNVFGDGSAAVFNPGASLRVRIGVDDGTTNTPQCVGNG